MRLSGERIFRFTPEALWVFVGQCGSAIAGLIAIKVISNLLSQPEYGKYALASTLMSFIGANVFGPFGQGFMRFWSISKDKGNLDAFYHVSNRFIVFISMFAVLVAAGIALYFYASKHTEWAIIALLSLVLGTISGMTSMRTSVWSAMRQRRKTALTIIFDGFSKPLLAALLVILTIRTVNSVLIGYLLGALLTFFIVGQMYAKDTGVKLYEHPFAKSGNLLRKDLSRKIILYSWPFVVWGLFGWMHAFCDRWILNAFFGLGVVGGFAVVSQLASYPLLFGSGFLCNLLTPVAFQRAGKLSDHLQVNSAVKILKAMTAIYIIGLIAVFALFFFLHRQLVLLVSSQAFVRYSYLLPGLVVAWGLFYLGQVLTQFGLLYNKSHVYIYPKIFCSLIALAGVFFFTSLLGVAGVVWGLTLANLVYVVWCFVIFVNLKKSKIVVSES